MCSASTASKALALCNPHGAFDAQADERGLPRSIRINNPWAGREGLNLPAGPILKLFDAQADDSGLPRSIRLVMLPRPGGRESACKTNSKRRYVATASSFAGFS